MEDLFHSCDVIAHPRLPSIKRLVGLYFAVAILAWFSIALTRGGGQVAVIWPANGLVLATLLSSPKRHWIFYVFAAFLGNISGEIFHIRGSLLLAIALPICNSMEVLLAAKLLYPRFKANPDITADYLFLRFIAYGALLAPAVTAIFAAIFFWLATGADLVTNYSTWFTARALGAALIVPMALMLKTKTYRNLRLNQKDSQLYAALLVFLITGVTIFIFDQARYPFLFFIFPVLIFSVFRFGFPGGIVSLLIVSVISFYFTVISGSGPITLIPHTTMPEKILILQFFIATLVLTTLPVGVILGQRDRLEWELRVREDQFRHLSEIDGLTGIANRRRLNEVFQAEWARAFRNGEPISFIILDVDWFKAYNDKYGHGAGDECLKLVAQTIASSLERPTDLAARYGGEEFAVILPNTDKAGSLHVAERILTSIAKKTVPHTGSPLNILTVSIGVATAIPRENYLPSAFSETADLALYQAKQQGRNRFIFNEFNGLSRNANHEACFTI